MLKKILVVEDNSDSRQIIATLLRSDGFNVLTAEDGRAGLKAAEAEAPELIITDLNMPDLDGFKMIKQLRGQPRLTNVPIIAVTAHGKWNAELAIQAGADDSITKPLDLPVLMKKVKQLMERRATKSLELSED